jgi:CheY-like chemotaxis protein
VPTVEREAEPAGRLRVLLVDDDDLIRSSMGAVLEMLGHALMAVPSGEEALAMLETGFMPDVVILDMNMPGLGGTGTLPRLRSLLPTVPILLATGRADQAAVDLSRAYPQVTLLAKPFNMAMLKKQLGMLTPARAE